MRFYNRKLAAGALVTVVVFSILIKLGLWQLSRSEEKVQMEQMMAQRAQQPPIKLSQLTDEAIVNPNGLIVQLEVLPLKEHYILLDNQSFNGQVGYLALQLVRTEGHRFVLFEVGFIPAPRLRDVLPVVQWLEQPFAFTGRLYRKSENPLSKELLLEEGSPSRIQNLNITQLSAHWNTPIELFVVQPIEENWRYPQPWQPIPLGSGKHLGYAVQWFGMATALFFFSLFLLFRLLKQGGIHY